MSTSICSPSRTGCRVQKVCSGWCGRAAWRSTSTSRKGEAQTALGNVVASVSVVPVERDRVAVETTSRCRRRAAGRRLRSLRRRSRKVIGTGLSSVSSSNRYSNAAALRCRSNVNVSRCHLPAHPLRRQRRGAAGRQSVRARGHSCSVADLDDVICRIWDLESDRWQRGGVEPAKVPVEEGELSLARRVAVEGGPLSPPGGCTRASRSNLPAERRASIRRCGGCVREAGAHQHRHADLGQVRVSPPRTRRARGCLGRSTAMFVFRPPTRLVRNNHTRANPASTTPPGVKKSR